VLIGVPVLAGVLVLVGLVVAGAWVLLVRGESIGGVPWPGDGVAPEISGEDLGSLPDPQVEPVTDGKDPVEPATEVEPPTPAATSDGGNSSTSGSHPTPTPNYGKFKQPQGDEPTTVEEAPAPPADPDTADGD